MLNLLLKPGHLGLSELRKISRSPVNLSLDPAAIPDIEASMQVVEQVIAEDRTVYGINTGFGLLANTKIAPEDLEVLQKSIVLSHAAGIGKFMSDETVRLMMVLKINSLSRGYSGIRLKVINALIDLVNAQVYPCVPQKGSVGASGDLAPLAHMSTVLLGEGQARHNGKIITGLELMLQMNRQQLFGHILMLHYILLHLLKMGLLGLLILVMQAQVEFGLNKSIIFHIIKEMSILIL